MIDEELQRKMSLQALFNNADFRVFEQWIADLWKMEDNSIKELTKYAVDPKNIADLNAHIARRQAYQQILLFKAGLIDELRLESDDMDAELLSLPAKSKR